MKLINFKLRNYAKSHIHFIACFLDFYVFAQDLIITNKQNAVLNDINQIADKALEVEKVYIKSRLRLSMYFLGIGTI
ncbi:MAG: hypothetical protein ACKO96_02650 [Flammeovirgaceae bacterium]